MNFSIHSIPLLFLPIFFLHNGISAQSSAEIEWLKNSAAEETKTDYNLFARENNNEFEVLFSALFLMYKNTLSIQDVPSTCFFTPSCSVYAISSIKKKGIFLGVLSGIERITRCNGLDNSLYEKDEKTGRLIDEP